MKLIFHIGMPKTGSTSLQTCLCNHRDSLREQGIIYEPEVFDGEINHNKFFLNFNDESIFFLKDRIEKNQNYPYYLISSEILFRMHQPCRVLKQFLHEYEGDIVLYLRRQDDLFDSLFKQRVKIGQRQRKVNVDDIDNDILNFPENPDYRKTIHEWEIFDNCTFHILKYHPEKTIQQFLSLYNINIDVKKSARENLSQSKYAAELGNCILWNMHEKLTPARYELVRLMQDFYDQDADSKRSTHIYTSEERRKIMAHYAESNAWVSQRFFDGSPLFPSLPQSEDDEEPSALTVEKSIRLLSKILFFYARSNLQIKRLMAYVEQSGEFDKEFYEAAYVGKRQDLPYSPLEHFARFGIASRLKPHAGFDSDKILEEYPELQDSGIPPFIIHLVRKAIQKSGK